MLPTTVSVKKREDPSLRLQTASILNVYLIGQMFAGPYVGDALTSSCGVFVVAPHTPCAASKNLDIDSIRTSLICFDHERGLHASRVTPHVA